MLALPRPTIGRQKFSIIPSVAVRTENLIRSARLPVMKQVLPARYVREGGAQHVEIPTLSAEISRRSHCFLSESPCISQFNRERRVGLRLPAQPRFC